MLGNKFKEIITNLENHIQDKNDLDYAKKQVTDLTMSFLDELGKIEELYDHKISHCVERITDLEKELDKLEEEQNMSMNHREEALDVEPITCPYCNTRFLIEFNSKQKEVKCPDCKNIIELDWENFEDDDM